MQRRECLKILGLTGANLLAPMAWANHHRRVERVGLQLYTVREAMDEDVGATLAAVAAAGYQEVETAGTADLSPTQFAQILADVGLQAPAAHVPLDMMDLQPEELLNVAQTLGYQYLVVPWIPPQMRNIEGYARTVEVLNGFGEQCAREGIRVAYHNHNFEFEALGDERAYDFLLRNTDPTTVWFELDLYWAADAGVDTAGYLKAQPDRYALCHVKDRRSNGEMVDVGAGEIDFPALFALGSGFKHYFVEHDRPEDAMASIRASIAAVQRMRF